MISKNAVSFMIAKKPRRAQSAKFPLQAPRKSVDNAKPKLEDSNKKVIAKQEEKKPAEKEKLNRQVTKKENPIIQQNIYRNRSASVSRPQPKEFDFQELPKFVINSHPKNISKQSIINFRQRILEDLDFIDKAITMSDNKTSEMIKKRQNVKEEIRENQSQTEIYEIELNYMKKILKSENKET